MIDQEEAGTVAPPAAEKPKRRWGLILGGAVIVGVIVVTATVHLLGRHDALIAGGIAAAVVAAGAILWRLPHLRRHFARPGGSRSRSWRPFGGRGLFGGSARRGGLGRPGSRTGGLLGRKGAGQGGRRGIGSLLGRKPGGSARRGTPGSGTGRRGPLGRLFGRGRGQGAQGRRGLFGGRRNSAGQGGRGSRGRLFGKGRSGAGGAGAKQGVFRRAGRKLISPFRKSGSAGSSGSGSKGRSPAGRAVRGLGRGVRGAWRGTGGRLFKRGSKSGTSGGANPAGKSPSSRSPRQRLGTLGRAFGGIWKRARKAAGGKTRGNGTARPGWQRAAGVAGAVALLPLIGAWRGGRRFARWWKRRSNPDVRCACGATMPRWAAGMHVWCDDNTPADAEEQVPDAARWTPEAQPGPALNPRQVVTFTGTTGLRGTPMTHVEAAAEAIQEHIGGFARTEPTAVEFDRFLHDLPQVYGALASAFSSLADGFGDLPVHPAVREHIEQMASSAAGQQEYAEEAWSLHRTAHEQELQRIENPRPGEQMWDVDNQ